MKTLYSSIICILLIFSIGALAEAHPGRTDSKGGHTCRTNCEKWGLEYGEYHYHNSGGTTSNSGSKANSSSSATSKSITTTPLAVPQPTKTNYELADVTVEVNGKKLSFNQEPISIEHNTMVPMRDIFEALGANIKWESSTETVTATKGDISIKIVIGQSFATKNGQQLSLSQPAVIVNDKTMVPLRFVSEALGANVKWDENTRTVSITI